MPSISQFVTVEWAPGDTPSEVSPTWVDITSVVMSVDVDGGRSGVFDLYGPRTATIVCRNGTKTEAATFTVGTFYRWIQIRVTTSRGNTPFTGFVTKVEHGSQAPWLGTVTVTCVDKMPLIARGELFEAAPFGAVVNGFTDCGTVQEAANYVLTAAGLTDTVTVLSGSTLFVKAPPDHTGNLLSWLQGVLEAEVGGFQVGADSVPTVNGRWLPFAVALQAPSLVFSDTPASGEYQYLREDLRFASHDEDYYNRAVAKSAYWDTVFDVFDNPPGYPIEALARTDLPVPYESWAEADANHWLRLYKTTFTYPRSLTVSIASHAIETAAFASGSTLLADLIDVTTTFGTSHVVVEHTPTGVAQQTYHVTIENVHHSITPEQWTCTLGFASLDRWIAAYGDSGTIFELVEVDGDAGHGVDSDAIVAP